MEENNVESFSAEERLQTQLEVLKKEEAVIHKIFKVGQDVWKPSLSMKDYPINLEDLVAGLTKLEGQ